MQEVFYEETATLVNQEKAEKKYNFLKILSIVCYILFTLYAITLFTFFSPDPNNVAFSMVLSLFPLVILLASAIILGKIKNTIYIEYDYTFISGSIRVAKVIKDFKRRTIIKFEAYNIEKIGYYDSETYKKYDMLPGINKKILTHNLSPAENKNFYYIVVNVNGEKNLLIFECTKLFISNVLKFSRKTVLEARF